jgi:hypothetical protein
MRTASFLSLLIILALSSCDTTIRTDGSSGGRILPNVTGGAGEVLVVMDEYVWKGEAGNSLDSLLEEEYPALPQVEPLFSVTQITPASFDQLFRFHRSVVMGTINQTLEEPTIRFRKNVWAKPQIVVQMQAPSIKELTQLIDENRVNIQRFLVQYDRQRLEDSYRESKDLEIQNKMAETHHIRLSIPRGYNIDLMKDDYSSVSIETPDFIQVIHVFEWSANGPEDLTTTNLLEKRDEVCRQYVIGPRENSYMRTAPLYTPLVYDIQKNGISLVEIRGLWELENGYMGGPFMSHSVFDENRSRIVTVEGYLYYPNQKKRVKMRQLEAIVYSLELM